MVITLLVMIGLGYTAIWGIGTEGAGAASGIKQGLDLAGGVSITYQAVGDEAPSSEDMSDTIYKLQKGLKSTALRRRYIRKEQIELISRFLVCRMQIRFWKT